MSTAPVTVPVEAPVTAAQLEHWLNRHVYRLTGPELRAIRAQYDLKAAALARRIGYSRAQVSNWEAGRHAIPVAAYPAIFAALADAKAEAVEYRRVVAELSRWPTIGTFANE